MVKWNKIAGRLGIVLITALLLGGAFWVVGPTDTLRDLLRFPLWSIIGIIGIFALNLFVVSGRLGRILQHFGVPLSFGAVLRANISGHLAGLFVLSIFGQVIGRHLALRKFGVSAVLVATLTAYERVVLVLVGGGLCLGGAVLLINQSTVFDFLRSFSLFEILLTAGGGVVLSLLLGRSKFEKQLLLRMVSQTNIVNLLEISVITLLGQMLVLASFVMGVLALNPDVDFLSVMAAAAIISFAASMPVTVNGWGIRELTAVYILGQLGISSSNALAVSILVGLCSTAVVLVAASATLRRHASADVLTPVQTHFVSGPKGALGKAELEKAAVWISALAAAALIFFQVHAALPSGTINLNLADPFAIIALASMVGHGISTRQFPRWRVPGFNWVLVALSALLVFAFFRGMQEIGVTQWAFASRLMGWLVLMGYLSIGYLLVFFAGTHGLRRFAETMVSTAVAIVLFQSVAHWANYAGLDIGAYLTTNFEGYAGNRNAFAFQLLVSSAFLLAYSSLNVRSGHKPVSVYALGEGAARGYGLLGDIFRARRVLISLLQGVLCVGIIYTGSLGGLIVGSVLLATAWVFRFADRRMLEMSVFFGCVLWAFPHLFFWLQTVLHTGISVGEQTEVWSLLSREDSHVLRWETITKGLELWWKSPLFGAGLGVFYDQSTAWFGRPTVIHSTPVWVLSEFGLFGLVIVGWAFLSFVRFFRQVGTPLPAHRAILMLLLVFSLFGIVHEIFFQRIFWLALGATVALGVSFGGRRYAAQLVCHIITGLNAGGAERMLTRLVNAPDQNGVKHMVVSLMDEGVFGQEIRAQGVSLHTLGMRPGVPSLAALWRLITMLRLEKPDVLMSWLYHADLIGFIAAGIAGVRHNYWNLRCSDMTKDNRSILSRMMMWLLIHLSPYPTGVIANSEAGMRHHQSLGYRPKKWHVISNGVNLEQFRPEPSARVALRAELLLPDDAVLVGHVARFHPMKDHATLLDAAAMVVRTNVNVHFVLVGKDVNLNNPFFAEQLERRELAGRVHLLGGHRNIPEVLAGLDLMVLSSAYGEGAPNVLIEAMACGVPCVTSDVGDAALIVDTPERVVKPQDPIALAEAILRFLALPEAEREAQGKLARARTQEYYDINNVIDRYGALLLSEN